MTTYRYPEKIDFELLKENAHKRRKALVNSKCSTFELGFRNSIPSIMCLCCGLGSASPMDIANKYCGFCQEFHVDWEI